MNTKTTKHAAKVVEEIKGKNSLELIEDYEILLTYSMESSYVTGFAVIMTLNKRYFYKSTVLDGWQKKLEADNYMITVKGGKLIVRFNVKFDKNIDYEKNNDL